MQQDHKFDILIRKVVDYSDTELMYRITLFKRIQTMDELLIHPRVSTLIEDRVVRLEKVDNFRFRIFITKVL